MKHDISHLRLVFLLFQGMKQVVKALTYRESPVSPVIGKIKCYVKAAMGMANEI